MSRPRMTGPALSVALALVSLGLALSACSREENSTTLQSSAKPMEHLEKGKSSRETSKSRPDASPMSGEWRLVAIDSTELNRGATPTVVFGGEGWCWGSTGVNQYRSSVKLEGVKIGRLEVGSAAVTRKSGPPEAMAVERLFLQRLENSESYEIAGDLLYLNAGEDQNLTFERVNH